MSLQGYILSDTATFTHSLDSSVQLFVAGNALICLKAEKGARETLSHIAYPPNAMR